MVGNALTPPRSDREEENRVHIGSYTPGDIALFKDIADAAAESAVKRLFVAMGLNPDEPLNSQRDFQALRKFSERQHDEDHQRDVAWVRRWRGYTEGMVGKIIVTVLAIALAGAAHTLWVGFQTVVQPSSTRVAK